MRAVQASIRAGRSGLLLAACRAASSSSSAPEQARASDVAAGLTAHYSPAPSSSSSSSSSRQGSRSAADAADAAWVQGGTVLSEAAGGGDAEIVPRAPSHPLPARPLGPHALLRALGTAHSLRAVAHLLVEHRDVASSAHLVRAAKRMGELHSRAGHAVAPRTVDSGAFCGALDLALDMLRHEGEILRYDDACGLLEAAAWMRAPLSAEQRAALEAAAERRAAGPSRSMQLARLVTSYIRLELQPGPRLAALLAPSICRGDGGGGSSSSSRNVRVRGEQRQQQQHAAPAKQQHPNGAPSSTAVAAAAGRGAAEAALAGQEPSVFVPLGKAELLAELGRRGAVLLRLLRLVLLHQPDLTPAHLLAALRGMGERAVVEPRHHDPMVQATFAALRSRALAALADAPDALDVAAAATLVGASADMSVPLAEHEQAALEAAAVRGWGEARLADLHRLAAAYDALDMQPSSGSGMAEEMQRAAEFLLHAADARQLAGTLRAWHRRGWPITPALAAAADKRAVQLLGGWEAGGDRGDVAAVLEGLTTARPSFSASAQLEAAARRAVLRALPGAGPEFASCMLSCCRKLGLLPNEGLLAAFLEEAPAVLDSECQAAYAYVPRLLMAMVLQGWHYSTASPAVRHTMQELLGKQQAYMAHLVRAPYHSPAELSASLGLVCHGLHLLAAVGMRPGDEELLAVCRYLRRHERVLSGKQRRYLRGAFEAWRERQHGLRSLEQA